MRKIHLLTILSAFLAILPYTSRAETWKLTLADSIERALAANRDIAIAKDRLLELDGLKGEAMSMGLPQLTGTADYTHTFRRPEMSINDVTFKIGKKNAYSAGVGLNQLLFDGGKVFKAIRAAKAEELRGIETVRDLEEKIRVETKQTFFEILYTDKVIDVLERQLKTLNEHLISIKTRFKEGLESDYTLMRQEVEITNIEPDLTNAKRNKELLINGMELLLVIPQTDELTIVGEFDYKPKPLPTISELTLKALNNRADLKAEKFRLKSLTEAIGVEKATWWPNLNIDGSFQWQTQTDSWSPSSGQQADSLQLTANLSWPLFDGLKTASRVKQARARLTQQQSLTSQMEDGVIREVKDLYETLELARESLNAQRNSLNLARRATTIAGERFEAGLMSQIELNDTINSQARAEQLFLRTAFDCLNAEAALQKAVGGEL